MDATHAEFLNETSCSQTAKSPIKTSTAAKANAKWNEDAFFKRPGIANASESLFIPPAESPIVSSKELVTAKECLQKIKFNINDSSFISDKANSSLGILNIDNLSDLSDISFKSDKLSVNPQNKKKLQRASAVSSGENNVEKEFCAATEEILENVQIDSAEETGSNSSSDIEFDGTNIPELNMDCDILSLISSSGAQLSSYYTPNTSSTFTKTESDFSESNTSTSQFKKQKLPHSANRASSENLRQSIFENFQPSYDSLYEQLASEKTAEEKNGSAPKTVRVCPFLDVSSFEVERILHKSSESSISSDIESARCNQNLSVDFCPEQISARSSSLKSSRKYSSALESSNVCDKEKNTSDFDLNQLKMSFLKEDLENEVSAGSSFQVAGTKSEPRIENFLATQSADSLFPNFKSSATFTKNSGANISGFDGLPSNVLPGNFSDFAEEEGNWCSRLGLSDSDFFNSEAAKDILRKDKETFEKEQRFELIDSKKVSSASNWSPPNQLDVTPPSWFTEMSPNGNTDVGRHISIGTLISARSENVGTLSDKKDRERPYFGTNVTTPPKSSTSEYQETRNSSVLKTTVDGHFDDNQESSFQKIRQSALSAILNEISLSDPVNIATKISEKCMPSVQEFFQKLDSNCNKTKENESEHLTKIPGGIYGAALSDIEESEDTFTESTSGDPNKDENERESENYANIKNKSTVADTTENSLNYSLDSASDRGSIKTTKSDTCSNCSHPVSQNGRTQEFSRPTSSCSSTCNIMPLENAFNLHYSCTKFLNSGSGPNQNGISNVLQAGSSMFPCQYVCAQHSMQQNILPFGTTNALQSVFQNPVSGQVILSGPIGIQAPSELYFPEKIAIGDSQEMTLTIQNSSRIACSYHISCVSAYLNDSPLPFDLAGVSYNKMAYYSIGNNTDVKIILSPKHEGKIEVNLQIDAFLNPVGQTLNVTPGATFKTKIQYEAVRPSISILYKGKNTFNLGTVIAGSTFVEHITIINNCEIQVPLRISLSNDSPGNQIYFGLKELNRQKLSTSVGVKFLSPTVLLFRLPGSKNKELPSSLDVPVVFESINGPINSSITAAIETAFLREVMAFIKVSAAVGTAKLTLKDSNENPLILKACKGATCSHSVTVTNDGTLPVVYDIHIDGDSDVLSVSPTSLNLQPNQSSVISVSYTPQSNNAVKGNLLAAAQPHGQVFVVTEIIGHVQENYFKVPYINNYQFPCGRPTRDSIDCNTESSNLIECDKKYLAWGGNDIGSVVVKTFTIRNSKPESIQVKIFIKQKSNGFMLLDESNEKTTCELMLNSLEEKQISVVFTPKSVIAYSGILYIKPVTQNESKVFRIPLSGYGGTSCIKVLGLPNGERVGYCLDVDVPTEAEVVQKNIVLHNSGSRPAFVKLLITYDSLVQEPASKQTVINPSEFVLLEKEKKNVSVTINCVNRGQMSSNEVITILYGDEILRQQLRRKHQSSSYINESSCNINFNLHYDGEDRVPYDSSYPSSFKDETLFNTNLKKLMIHVFLNGHNRSFSRMSFGALTEVQDSFANMTLDSTVLTNSTRNSKYRRMTKEGNSPPIKGPPLVHSISRLSLPIAFDKDVMLNSTDIGLDTSSVNLSKPKLDTWSVSPKELVIDADNKDKRLLLKSYCSSDMRFKVEWTIDIITISPANGILFANEEIGLRLTLINTNHNKLSNDYHGTIKILCDGIEKSIPVKVSKIRSSCLVPQNLNESLRSGFLGDSYTLDNTVTESVPQYITVENIFSFPKDIDLHVTKQGVLSETILIVTNPTKHTVEWSINPVAMLFSEPFDDSVDNISPTIEFPARGFIEPMATENILVKFFPRTAARFQQFFKLVLNSRSGESQTYNIKVHGEAFADLSATVRPADVKEKKKQTTTVKKRVKSEVFTENDFCKFPTTISGQKSTEGIILKNITLQNIKLTIIKPKQPFSLNLSSCTVKSKKFLRLPVSFKPLKPGNYESEVKFVRENGDELKVRLSGSCSA